MPNIIKDGWPEDDYAIPSGLSVEDVPLSGNWKDTIREDMEHDFERKRKAERSEESHERELRFDEPRWGEMGGGEGDE